MKGLIFLAFAPLLFSCAINPEAESTIAYTQLPHWTLAQLETPEFKSNYNLDLNINPYYLRADFNGDGDMDFAAVIKEKSSGSRGIIILQQGKENFLLFGAGLISTLGGKDWEWLKGWKVERRLTGGANIKPNKGDALILFAADDTAKWLYWSGEQWEWVNQR